MMEIEALEQLIIAVETYGEDLMANRAALENAANVCDVAMGSDAIAKKYIARLYEALEELDKTRGLVEEVAVALKEDKSRALNVLED